jgi:hypothetical protein
MGSYVEREAKMRTVTDQEFCDSVREVCKKGGIDFDFKVLSTKWIYTHLNDILIIRIQTEGQGKEDQFQINMTVRHEKDDVRVNNVQQWAYISNGEEPFKLKTDGLKRIKLKGNVQYIQKHDCHFNVFLQTTDSHLLKDLLAKNKRHHLCGFYFHYFNDLELNDHFFV